MKTKPNFTYKQFIEKISNVQIGNKDKPQSKSPKALKSHNKNIPQTYEMNPSKAFQKKPLPKKTIQTSQKPTRNHPKSPLKPQPQQYFPASKLTLKPTTQKSTTNKKLKLKNTSQLSKHMKSTIEQGNYNFFNNESIYQYEKHNESCSTFMKNSRFENQEENSFGFVRSPSEIRIKSKNIKQSAGSIDAKFKLNKGNLTQRNCQRINTEYVNHTFSKPSDRLNTYYQRSTSQYDRQSPSFYKMSVDEPSFLQFQDDKSSKPLFAQTSRSKKSKISLSLQQSKPKTNEKSHQHIYNKFINTVSKALFQITRIQDQSLLLQHKIKYIEYLESLKQLKMIRCDYEPYQTEGVDLVRQLWQELVMGHNINHFIIILSIIMKITPIQHIKSQNATEVQNYIYLQKKYQQFRFTRLQLDKAKTYSQKQSIEYYNFPFQPTISKTSQQLASKPKSQRKYKINTSINHNQSLGLLSRRQNTSISTQFQNPSNHNQSVNISTTRQTSPLGNKRSQILYQQAKKKSLEKKHDKSTVDYEFQKNKNQLTFKPKITIKKKTKQPQQSACQYMSPRFAIDEEKTINRMIRGRVQRQVKQITIDRGLPYNQKTMQKLRRQKFEEIFKEQQQSRLKICHNQSKNNLNHNKSYQRCTTQVENLQNIMDMSFQQHQDQNVTKQQPVTQRIQSSPGKVQHFEQQPQNDDDIFFNDPDSEETSEDCFVLDIYFEQDRGEKIKISRNASKEEVIAEAQKFVKKHNLPPQMQKKLKNQLFMVTRFSDIQDVIQQNAEQEQCSLLM